MPSLADTIRSGTIGLCLVLSSQLVFGQANGKPNTNDKPDTADGDYQSELPRIPATDPDKALATFQIEPGFRLAQVAAEPLIESPVALAFDEDLRMFVVEMRDYSENDKDNLGRIKLLEDTDQDGRYDKSTVFVDGLSWPTAVTCFSGGIFVGAAPHLYFFKDINGDGVADIRQTVFTGFQRTNVQGLLNSFHWGLDGRIHVACSSTGAELTRLVERLDGVPGAVPSALPVQPLVVRGRDVAFDPFTLELLATSGGAQHGMCFNSWGDKFVCSNSDHVQLVMFEDRYVARNPYLVAKGARISIAEDGPQADVFRRSPVEPWRVVRTRLRIKGVVPGPIEGGGRAAGYFTSATGITVFTGNALGPEFDGLAIVGDVGSNIVHRKKLLPDGLRLTAKRIDQGKEFIASTDNWFRPVQFANAPDGCLYLLDMYREVIEHPASLPPAIKKHIDLTSGRERGRVYRVEREGSKRPTVGRLSSLSTMQLVATLEHPNGWHRETAARLLTERRDRRGAASLADLAAQSQRPEGRIQALWALAALEPIPADVIVRALADPHERVREHAVRLSERVAAESAEVRERLLTLANDPSLRVRYQLAFSLGELRDVRRLPALARIALQDPRDSYIKTAVLSSVAEGAGELMQLLAADAKFVGTAEGREILTALATQIGRQQRAADVAVLLQVLPTTAKSAPEAMRALVLGVAPKPGSELEKQVAAATGGQAEEVMAQLLAAAAQEAGNREAKVASRVDAVSRLRFGRFADRAELFAQLLEPTQPAEIHSAAIGALTAFDDTQVAQLILRQWGKMSPRVRNMAGDLLLSRQTWLHQLLDAMTAGTIAIGDIDPGRLSLLSRSDDETVRVSVAKVLAKSQSTDRAKVFESYRDVLDIKGNTSRGKEVFKKVCAACHQVEGIGHAIGPNLAAMKNRGPEAILTNVIMPNREVNPQFLNYLVTTMDGRTVAGMIAAETATSLTLKRAENQTDTVLRIDIDELRSTGVSIMPDGLEKQIDKQAMADVIEYLKNVE